MNLSSVTILGGGSTGRGMATCLAKAGVSCAIVEKTRELAERAREKLTARLDREIAKFGLTESEKRAVLARIKFGSDPGVAAESDLVVEAVPELLELKRRVLAEVEGMEDPEDRKVKLTCCAALEVSDLQDSLRAPGKLVGFHVIPPLETVPLVELVKGKATEPASLAAAEALAKRMGKKTVVVGEVPGLITTRILVPYLNEAMYALMEGVSDAASIDLAMKSGFGMTRGPLHLADEIGLDQVLYWMENLHRELGDLKYRPCPLLRRMVRDGKLGIKSGSGFFEYPEGG